MVISSLPQTKLIIVSELVDDHMHSAEVLGDSGGPESGGRHTTFDEEILNADGFAWVSLGYMYEIVKCLVTFVL